MGRRGTRKMQAEPSCGLQVSAQPGSAQRCGQPGPCPGTQGHSWVSRSVPGRHDGVVVKARAARLHNRDQKRGTHTEGLGPSYGGRDAGAGDGAHGLTAPWPAPRSRGPRCPFCSGPSSAPAGRGWVSSPPQPGLLHTQWSYVTRAAWRTQSSHRPS